MRVSTFILLAMLVMLSILPTFESQSSILVQAKGTHTGKSKSGKSKSKTKKDANGNPISKPHHIHSGPAFIVIYANPDGSELKVNSNECPVPYCVNGDNTRCGTVEECEGATVDPTGLSTPVIIVLWAVGGAICAYGIYQLFWKKWLKRKYYPKKAKKTRKQLREE